MTRAAFGLLVGPAENRYMPRPASPENSLDVGSLRKILKTVSPTAWVVVSTPDSGDQVVSSAGFSTYVPGGRPDLTIRDRVHPALTLQTDYPTGQYIRPVRINEDEEAWIHNREVTVDHVVTPVTAGELLKTLNGLPDRFPIEVVPLGQFDTDIAADTLHLTLMFTEPGDKDVVRFASEVTPLEFLLARTPPEGPGYGPDIFGSF